MDDSQPSLTYSPGNPLRHRKGLSISGLFILATLVTGALTTHLGYKLGFQLFGDFRAKYAIAASLAAGLLTCLLFVAAAWFRSSGQIAVSQKSRRITNTVILFAVYGPFFWVLSAPRWALFSPILPGFFAAMSTKPFDSRLLLVTACCLDTVMILWALSTVRSRHHHGFILAPVIALTISSLTSYAAYCAMRV